MSSARPIVDQDEFLEGIRDLVEQGKTDAAEGGVSPVTIAEELTYTRSSAQDHCLALVNEGRLERVHGLGPHGPRPSYLPAGDA